MNDSLTKYEQYTVICLQNDNSYFERTFNDEASIQSFIDELKLSESYDVARIFVSVCIVSKSLVEVV